MRHISGAFSLPRVADICQDAFSLATTLTTMDDLPYTTPDEDPFNVRPLPRRRRSSLLDKWIHEQQRYSPSPATHTRPVSASAASRAYLAYPELSRPSLDPATQETPNDAGYDLVDDDIPENLAADLDTLRVCSTNSITDTSSRYTSQVTDVPATLRARKPNSRMSFSPTSFRHFNLVFRSTASPAQDDDQATSSRKYIFSRTNRSPNNHGTVTSRALATRQSTPQKHLSARSSRIFSSSSYNSSSPNSAAKIKPSPSKWRPSVLGHFGQSPRHSPVPVASQVSVQAQTDSLYTPSRPSFSSSINTHTSLTVPSPEGSTSHRQPSPVLSERSQRKRYSHLTTQTPPHHQHNISPSGTSSVSFRSEARPLSSSSKNTPVYLNDLLSPDTGKASSSPTLSSSTAPRGFYPSIRSNGSQYSSRRSANTFDAITPTSYRSQYSVTDDGEDANGGCAVTNAPAITVERQQEQLRKKKSCVVYSSSSHGGTLSRMTSLSNINIPIIPKNRRKKKKLIVSGVAPDDAQKFEGVKRWCEVRVSQISLRLELIPLVLEFR